MGPRSCRLDDFGRLRPKIVQIGNDALRVRRRRENETLVVGQHLQ